MRCDKAELPDDYTAYKRTPNFTDESVPLALLRAHSTQRGIWALVHVLAGQLEYYQHAPFDTREILGPSKRGVVIPEVEHHVQCIEPVEFFVEFWRPVPPSA